MSQITEIAKITLAGTKSGVINVANISKPYGEGSDDVVSIGIALNGEDVQWKTHIPYANIDEIIVALQKAKNNK